VYVEHWNGRPGCTPAIKLCRVKPTAEPEHAFRKRVSPLAPHGTDPGGRPPRGQISYRAEVARKAIHLLALVIPLGMWLVGEWWSMVVLTPLALTALAADVLRARYRWANTLVRTIFGWMMRGNEQPPVGGPVVLNGATWVMLSAALLAIVFPVRIAIVSFTVFMLADAAAALIGRRFGRIRWPMSSRTLEGSAGFLVLALLLMLVTPGIVLWIGFIAVLLGCIAEAMPGPGNDNIRVPLVMATTFFILERFVLGMDINLFF
jgi:dolichol kinase